MLCSALSSALNSSAWSFILLSTPANIAFRRTNGTVSNAENAFRAALIAIANIPRSASLLGYYDSTMAEARRMVRGESDQLRVGYLASVGPEYVDPALTALRRLHPKVKTKLLDLTSGEQIMALRRGEIDLALTYLGSDFLSHDFYTRKVATLRKSWRRPPRRLRKLDGRRYG